MKSLVFKNKFFKFIKIHFIIFIPPIISAIYTFLESTYIKINADYYKLPQYYFEHLNLNSFLRTIILVTIFLFLINLYKFYNIHNINFLYFTFYFIIFIYHLFAFYILTTYNIFSIPNYISIMIFFFIIFIILKKFISPSIILSIELLIIIAIINLYSIKVKKEYEIATLKNYEQVVIIILKDSDYLVTQFIEKENILYIDTTKKRWINRLDFINIKTKKFKEIKINNSL